MPTRPEPDLGDDDELPDEELPLPPSDDPADDEREPDAGADEIETPDEVGLDDGAADDLDVGGDELDTTEEEADDDEREIDVGALDEDILVDEEKDAGSEVEAAADAEGIDLDEEGGEDDGGAEGTSEDPGDEIDEGAYPELDDDDGGAGDDDALAGALLAESEGDDKVPWAAVRWAPLEGAGADLPCRAVATADGLVAAAGEVLLFVDDGARVAQKLEFGEGSVAVALGERELLVATARGQLLAAPATAAEGEVTGLGSWRAGVEPSLGLRRAEARAPSVELAATAGRFWVRAGGALLCCASPTTAPAAVRERGVLAIAGGGGVLSALTLGAEGPELERFRSDDEGWAATALGGEARALVEKADGAVLLAAAGAGRAVALADPERVLASRDGGASFATAEVAGVVALCFAGEGADAPLLALVAAAGRAAALVEIDAAGQPHRVAEVPGGVEGAEVGLAWDAAREVVWVASAGGLCALGRPQRH